MLKHFIAGFLVKVVTGLDDTITHVPVISSVAPTKFGKIAFSIGTLVAVILAIFVSIFFAGVLRTIWWGRYLSASLLFLLAIAIYLDFFVTSPKRKVEQKYLKKRFTAKRAVTLFGVGFIASVATVVDDIVAYSALFLVDGATAIFVAAGILMATLLEIILVIYAGHKINKIPYKEEIAAAGLCVLGVITLTGLI